MLNKFYKLKSIDGAKRLTQTVKNSKYTTKNNEEIGRIHVSLLTSSDKAIDENSYAYELAEISGGIVYSGTSQVKAEPMVMRLALTGDTTKTEQTKETNNNLIKILGQGNEGKYTVITSTGLIDSVKLKTVLNDSNGTDTDSDGLSDWNEVNVDIVNRHLKNEGKQELKTVNNSDLPLFSDLILHSSEWGSFKPYLWSESDFARYAYANCFDNVRILPIKSDPSKADSDGDGFYDGITGKYSPIGYYNIKDKWALTTKPHCTFYQKNGNYYFNALKFPKTDVGNFLNGYGPTALNLLEEEQDYIYKLCKLANSDNTIVTLDPLLIMSICAHETGCQEIVNSLGYCGYMQFNNEYSDDYCYGIYYKGTVKKIIDIMYIDNYITKSDLEILQSSDTMLRSQKEDIIKQTYVGITFGTALLYQNNFEQKDAWEGLRYYCWTGDTHSAYEDYFYRNTLAKLIKEECIYENNYKHSVDEYYVIVNGISIGMSE